jgi:hydrogenase nickel incorporation protein HypA/HybF
MQLMHELPITQSILDLVLSHAVKAGGGPVKRVHLVVGELSRVVDESVSFYWNILTEGTAAEGSELHFQHVPLEMECRECRRVFRPGNLTFHCPSCDAVRVRVVGGRDLRVEAIDVDVPAEATTRSP